jgi:uncharacterized protein YjbI with pentapeptide repeats
MASRSPRHPRQPPVKRPRLPQLCLPELTPYEEAGLRPDGDHDAESLTDLDLSGADGAGSTFLDCALRRCDLTEAGLKRARLIDSVLDGVTGVGADLAEAELRDVELTDARLGGTQLHGARLTRVLVRGGKLDFLNLRQARLTDVVFEGCVLAEPDFGGATLERVSFSGCTLRRVDLTAARLRDVDLRDTAEVDLAAGFDRLAGAVISSAQLMDLAPALAAQLGVRVIG